MSGWSSRGTVYCRYRCGERLPESERQAARLNRTLPAFKQIGGLLIHETEFEKTAAKKIKRNRKGGRLDV